MPNGEYHLLPNDSIPTIQSADPNKRIDALIKITLRPPNNKHIFNCLSYLRHAILNPQETRLNCYRAIESLSHLVGGKTPINKWDNLWIFLNYEPKVEKTLREKVINLCYGENLGSGERHANPTGITGKDRDDAAQLTWQIVNRFIEIELHATESKKTT